MQKQKMNDEILNPAFSACALFRRDFFRGLRLPNRVVPFCSGQQRLFLRQRRINRRERPIFAARGIPAGHLGNKGTGGFVAVVTTYFHDAGKVCKGRYRFRYQDAAGKRKTV
ncbi:MAG: integrase DNA-binding domain-containing protein, partial [Oscillospiraceae bacterium]|nr:integrase DNA-binding domain-containing protein [Oscillospiraceae bacterium]